MAKIKRPIAIENLEEKAWFRLAKIIYLGLFGIALIAVSLIAYFQKPTRQIDMSKSVIVCSNNKRFPAVENGIYIWDLNIGDVGQKGMDYSKLEVNREKAKAAGYTDQEIDDYLRRVESLGPNRFIIEEADISPSAREKVKEVCDSNYTLEVAYNVKGSWGKVALYFFGGLGVLYFVFEPIKRVFLYVVGGKELLTKSGLGKFL